MEKGHLLIFLIFLVMIVSSCSVPENNVEVEEVECTLDEDCEEGYFCSDNGCEEVEEVECTLDEDCEEGFTCIRNECEEVEVNETSDVVCGDGICEDVENNCTVSCIDGEYCTGHCGRIF